MDLKGKGGEADIFREKAKDIRDVIDREWWDTENNAFRKSKIILPGYHSYLRAWAGSVRAALNAW